MRIQRMIYRIDGRLHKYNCGVNDYHHGGEFTFCGSAIPDSNLKYEEFESIGDEKEGTIKNITCPGCKGFIEYMKNLVYAQ